MEKNFWHVWIDTGGTFTDCIAKNPDGKVSHIKVLSRSALRGRITKKIEHCVYAFEASWTLDKDIFKDYFFQFIAHNELPSKVKKIDFVTNRLTLQNDLDIQVTSPVDFEISAHEEAPILATRLITGTSLTEDFPPLKIRLGSTIGTNALLERKGSNTALLVTNGFKNLLDIGNQQRPDIFSLHVDKPMPLCNTVIEVNERIGADGRIIQPLSTKEIYRICEEIKKINPESIAISFLHSYQNNQHELKILRALKKMGFSFVTASSEIAPVIHYLHRTQTTTVNAYLAPKVEKYLSQVNSKIPDGSLRVMTSAGGMVNYKFFQPKDSLFSGPAGGVVGASHAARSGGLSRIITFDMGGTSTDVARFDSKYEYQYETSVSASTIVSPSLYIETVASGGGSVCSFDGEKFSVGPESAGSWPGPACYGADGPITITDVNLLLGRIDEKNFGIPISTRIAEKKYNAFFKKDGSNAFSETYILHGFLKIANEKMANAIKKISVNKGYNPQDYALVSFGGAGGQHACDIAEILGIEKILVPFDASLLSAHGMGSAIIERFVVKQILRNYDEVKEDLLKIIKQCSQEAIHSLSKEDIQVADIEIREVLLYLRFKGQETTLEIVYSHDILGDFQSAYRKLYGHWIDGRAIEVESIKVIAAEKSVQHKIERPFTNSYKPDPVDFKNSFINERWQKTPVYRWVDLKEGACLDGPALLTGQFTTLIINNNWNLEINHSNQAILSHNKKSFSSGNQENEIKVEGIELELFTNRFSALAEEMGALLKRTSFSVNIKERLDYSCALLDAEGDLIVNAPHIPVHLGGLGLCVRSIMNLFNFKPGDVVITNHPKYGGSHLPDITLIAPVFDDKKELLGFVANRAHHAELGGKRPGSMPPDAVNLAEEGVVIHPFLLIENGAAKWDKIEQILSSSPYPSRNIQENLADLSGALASIQSGIEGLQKIAALYTTGKVKYFMKQLKVYAGNQIKMKISDLNKKNFFAMERLDDGSELRVDIRLIEGILNFDFTGSSDIHKGNLNATPAIVRSAVLYVLRLLLDENLPLNEGLMISVNITLPNGILNPVFPDDPANCPAVVGGNTETSQRLVDTILKAFELSACSQGTMNNFLFGNSKFSYYETICGGTGAVNGFHGTDAVHQHMTNTRITDAEILEFRYPVRLDHFKIRLDSGGKGKWHGGNGVVRKITFLENLEVTLLAQHREEKPYGIFGGEPGKTGLHHFYKKNNDLPALLKGIDAISVRKGDSIEIFTPGGGGWGTFNDK